MSRIRLTIDGDTIMDGDLGQWQNKPPESLTQHLDPTANLQPWAKAAMLAIVQAALEKRDTAITVTTRDRGWTLDVDDAN